MVGGDCANGIAGHAEIIEVRPPLGEHARPVGLSVIVDNGTISTVWMRS